MKMTRFKHIAALAIGILLLSAASYAQSTDPDAPTPLTDGEITGSSRGNLYDDKTYYFSINVKPGVLTLTADLTPVKGTGGGTLRWEYLDTKFKRIKWDQMSASGNPERRVNDTKVLAKRKVILKVIVGGNVDYRIKLSGTAY